VADPEVLIVGGGIVGAATSYFLARAGVPNLVVERHEPAWGASGRNPGYVWTHTRAEGVQMELAKAGRSLYDELVEELDDFEFRASGGMIYFFEDSHDLFPRFVEGRRRAGLPMELLDGDAARERCAVLPDDIAGATFNPLDAHVEPTKLTQALIAGAGRLGAGVRSASVEALLVERGADIERGAAVARALEAYRETERV